MRLHTKDLGLRVLGTLTGVGFLLVGLYAIFGEDDGSVAAAMRTRANWFGVATLVAGVWAIAVSWLEPDLSGVWCRRPRDSGPPPP